MAPADLAKSLTELALALAISVALPYGVRVWQLPHRLHEPEARHSALAAAAAVLPGYWLQRNMGRLPGARALSGILTAQFVAFGAVTVIVLLARMSYSRTILAVSFLLAVAWFYLVGSLARPRRGLRLGVVAGEHVASLAALSGLDCRMLGLADWPDDVDAVTADFRFDHGDAWEVRLDSAGPALFRQQRVGYRGRPFTLLKFRTMHNASVPASSDILSAITQPDDARITRIGAVLRRRQRDELPQIINILRGDTSWIGPRPEAVALSAWYQAEIPFYRYRHVVRPGISGWAQVNQGHVHGVEDVRRKLQFDFYYIRNFSVWLDLLIVIRTLQTMLSGFGHR
jgi:lipopolysaccharide/colanic/teichoic acid biosynthesis glycosyltransferase